MSEEPKTRSELLADVRSKPHGTCVMFRCMEPVDESPLPALLCTAHLQDFVESEAFAVEAEDALVHAVTVFQEEPDRRRPMLSRKTGRA